MSLSATAKKEVARINKFLPAVKAKKPKGTELLSFAKDYASDSKYFLKKGKFIEAFEAAIISWAYIDIGLKMKVLEVSKTFLGNFTVDKV